MTSSTVSSDSVDRQARGDKHTSETPEELLHEPTEIPKSKKNENHEQVRRHTDRKQMGLVREQYEE